MKSQISIFIIIGLILVAIFSIVTIKFRPDIISTSNDTKKVTGSMETCLMDISLQGIELMGKQGMIYPTTYLASEELKIAYFYFKGKKYMPSLENYEEELAQYINENIYDCVKKQKFSIETSEMPDTNVEFSGNVTIDITYPMVIRSKSGESDAEFFKVNLDLNFSGIHSKVDKIINSTLENPEWIYLDELSEDQTVKLVRVDKSTLIYIVKKEGNVPFEFRYAVKYS